MRRHNAPRFRACRAGLLLATGLLLLSCGTDLRGMMAEDSALFWEADQTIGEAEGRDPALTTPVRRAEAAKDEACQFMADGATERMNHNDPTFWEGFVSDFGQLVALVFPVPMVERCAAAQAAYRQSLGDLRQQLNATTETALRLKDRSEPGVQRLSPARRARHPTRIAQGSASAREASSLERSGRPIPTEAGAQGQ